MTMTSVAFVLNAVLAAGAAPVPAEALSGYAHILSTRVAKGRVDYKAIEASAKDRARLDAFVDAVAKAKVPADKSLAIGLYVDAYNALVLKSVIDNGRPRSVLDVKGFFDKHTHVVAGKKVTLDHLEKKLLNPYAKDPRTHMVLVCAAVGCPLIDEAPYLGSDVDARFDRATRRYLASPTGAVVSQGRLKLSKIFDWYKEDFGGTQGVLQFVRKHLAPEAAAKLGPNPTVSFVDYNWTLNQQ